MPAAPGVIAQADIGQGKPAQAGQPGEIRPADSSLVGDKAGGLPAAAPKAAGPKADMPRAAAPAATDMPKAAAAAAPARRSGGFLPLALGGGVAAALGAAAAIYVLPHLPPEWQPRPAAEAPVSGAVDEAAIIAAAEEAARRTIAQELEALPDTVLGQPPAELTEGLELQAMRIDALEEQLAAIGEQQPQSGQPAESADAGSAAPDLAPQIEAMQQRLDAQQAALDELAARPAFDPEAAEALQQQIASAAAEAEERLAAARAEAEALQEAAAEGTRRAEAVAAIAALQTALDQGVTPDQAREALAQAGLDAPEALSVAVPPLGELQDEFPEAARAALRAGLQAETASGQGNLVTNFLRAQTGARSVTPREGDDPDAILSRADAHVAAGRIAEAQEELTALPEAARTAPAMAGWLSRAEIYTRAQAALSDLSSQN